MQLLFSGAVPSPDHQRGAIGLLGVFDVGRGEVIHETRWEPPAALRAPGQKIQLTGFAWSAGSLLVCTHNAVLVYEDWPPRRPARIVSLPGFNDLHHCRPWKEGLAIANTGLEAVDWLDAEGKLLQRWDLLEGTAGARRIDPARDLRLVPDTKPHHRHPNHLFEHEGELWVTQLRTRDAVRVGRGGGRIEIPEGMPHDGTRVGDHLLFTTINGWVVRIPARPGATRQAFDLGPLDPDYEELGWCRGICPDPENAPDGVFVAFSMVRRPRWRELGYLVKHLHRAPPSRLCRYDLSVPRRTGVWQIGPGRGYVLFQIAPLPRELELPLP